MELRLSRRCWIPEIPKIPPSRRSLVVTGSRLFDPEKLKEKAAHGEPPRNRHSNSLSVEARSVCRGTPAQIDLGGIGHGEYCSAKHDGILDHKETRKGKEGEPVHTWTRNPRFRGSGEAQ